nr:MAG TPA: hypothetical protein [Caudoviricetes sp.]
MEIFSIFIKEVKKRSRWPRPNMGARYPLLKDIFEIYYHYMEQMSNICMAKTDFHTIHISNVLYFV